MSLRQTLRGTGVALVTPLTPTGKIDFSALESLINFVIKNGVEYVVSLGTTGETPTLSKSEKTDIINRRICKGFKCWFESLTKRAPISIEHDKGI